MKQFTGLKNKTTWVLILAFLLPTLLAACSPTASAQQPTASANPPMAEATVQAADNPKLGKILVNASGMTLYTFEIDTATESKCITADCVAYWPPLTVNATPTGGSDVPGTLATISRPDGTMQVTYQGQPLYTFALDKKPGDVTGDNLSQFGGLWHVVTLK